jgi:hypothetical protein
MFIISPTPARTPAPQGVWDILSSGHLFQPCLSREALYLAAGVALLLVTDTLYANAYLQGAYLPARFSAGGWLPLRSAAGVCGALLVWVGGFALLDQYLPPAWLGLPAALPTSTSTLSFTSTSTSADSNFNLGACRKNGVLAAAGFLLLLGTGTFFPMSGRHDQVRTRANVPTRKYPRRDPTGGTRIQPLAYRHSQPHCRAEGLAVKN